MQNSQKKLCPAPWRELVIGRDSQRIVLAPCCRFQYWHPRYQYLLKEKTATIGDVSASFKTLQTELLNHDSVIGCAKCDQEERLGKSSLRSKLIERYSEDSLGDSQLHCLEISLSNRCNMACRICNSSNSRLWEKLYNNSFWQDGVADELSVPRQQLDGEKKAKVDRWHIDLKCLESLPLRNLKRIKILGGEPFLDPMHLPFLIWLQARVDRWEELQIEYHTNGSSLPPLEVVPFWQKCRSLRIALSIDAVGSLNEYMRVYSSWSQISKIVPQLHQLLKVHEVNVQFVVHSVLTSLTGLQFGKLIQWVYEDGFNLGQTLLFTFDICNSPRYLHPSNLPLELRDLAIQRIIDLPSHLLPEEKKKALTNAFNQHDFDQNLFQELLQKTRSIDRANNFTIQQVEPSLGAYFK